MTELDPADLPAGVSPDNWDVEFSPGSVFTRRGLTRLYSTPLGITTITYAKQYITPTATYNLVLDAKGNLWVENVTAGTPPAVMLTTTPGSYGYSVTAFDREYIAFSDGLIGTDFCWQFDGTKFERVTADGPAGVPVANNIFFGTVGVSALVRTGNVVSVTVASAYVINVGNLVQLTGVPALTEAISTIVIDNEDYPGLAKITTSSAHGLSPQMQVSLTGVNASGTVTVSTYALAGGVVTVVTATAHNLTAGVSITISGASNAQFDGVAIVVSIANATTFTFIQNTATALTGTGGTLAVNWPVPDTTTPTYFIVDSVPSADVFFVAINYADSSFTGGNVGVPWDGTFYVTQVGSPTQFMYSQIGPDGTPSSLSSASINGVGQVSPGQRQLMVLFETDQGAITVGCPPITFTTPGGQYLQINNLPIGPSYVQSRIIAFTGAGGSLFYYLPQKASINGQIVSTSTVVPNNTDTAVVIDFSDNTLYTALGINIPGNNIPTQLRLPDAIAFANFNERLIAIGMRNVVQNLLNMSFDAGYSTANIPDGWTVSSNSSTGTLTLIPGRSGFACSIQLLTNSANNQDYLKLTQSAHQAYDFSPIVVPLQTYNFRLWVSQSIAELNTSIQVSLVSLNTSFISEAVIPGSSLTVAGSWIEVPFTLPMPAVIPPDMLLGIDVVASIGVALPVTIVLDDMNLVYADRPTIDLDVLGSYINNPEGMSGTTGFFGPDDDPKKIMGISVINGTPYMGTQDPNGQLHVVNITGTTEPTGWDVEQVSSECGFLSIFGQTQIQAGDGTSSGGERWFAYISKSGARIFGGGQPWKLSQEIQPDWDSINTAAYTTLWALNDPNARVLYFGLATNDATAPNRVYTLTYKDLDSAEQIASATPILASFQGSVAAGDRARKWTRYNRSFNGMALIDGFNCFFAGTAEFPNADNLGFGNLYYLTNGKLSDDDYGAIGGYWTTHGFPTAMEAKQNQLGASIMDLSFLTGLIAGTGELIIRFFQNSLDNLWPLKCVRTLSNPSFENIEYPGALLRGYRMFAQISAQPVKGNDAAFSMSQLTPYVKPSKLKIRGAAEAIGSSSLDIIELKKFDPRYTMYMRGFDRRGCTAAFTQATETSFKISGVWSDVADFVVLMLWDTDDVFGHLFTSKYLPTWDLRGLVLTFNLSISNGFYPGSAKSQSIPWGQLSYIEQDGTSNVVPLTNTISNAVGQQQASVVFTISGTPVVFDRVQLIFLGNYVFDWIVTAGESTSDVANEIVTQINTAHTTDPLSVPITATQNGSQIIVTATNPGTDGNTIQLLARNKTSTTVIEPQGLIKLRGGVDPTSFDVSIDFSALGLRDIRQCWLTLAPPLPIDSTFTDTVTLVPFQQGNFSYQFNKWAVSDQSSNRPLKIAGIGSVTVGNANEAVVYGGTWTQETGAFFQGYVEAAATPGNTVTITYTCDYQHDVYIGTSLYTDRGIFDVTLNGVPQSPLDCYLSVSSELNTRRVVAQRVLAGQNVIVLTIDATKNSNSTGFNCYFDYLQAVVAGDIMQPAVMNPRINAACDFDTDQTYKIPPSRSIMISRMLGFCGDLDFYAGVFFAQKRTRFGGFFSVFTVTISGTFSTGTGLGDGDAVFIAIGTPPTTYGAAFYPLDTNLTVAQRLMDATNALFVGVRASVSGTSSVAVLTMTLLSPINGFGVSASTNVGATGTIATTGNLIAGNEGIWQIDGTQTQPLNKAFSDYLRDLMNVLNSVGQTATVSFSQELLAPPDANNSAGAWIQRYGDGTTVLTATEFGSWGTGYVEGISGSGPQTITSTGHGYSTGYQVHVNTLVSNVVTENKGEWLVTVIDANTFQLTTFVTGSGTGTPAAVGDQIFADLQTSQCNFNPSTTTPYFASQYKQAAQVIAALGIQPWLQFGEILWWFFTGGATATMAYYDAYTSARATAILGRSLYVFTNPNDDPATNGYQDSNLLRGMLQTHLATCRSTVQSAVPTARFEILWPDDVNWPTAYENVTYPYLIGGALNRYVNLPDSLLTIGGVIDRWKTEALAWGSTYLSIDNAQTAIEMVQQFTTWPRNQGRYLVPWNTSNALWRQEFPLSVAILSSASTNINLWAIDHAILFSWDITTLIQSYLGGNNSGQ